MRLRCKGDKRRSSEGRGRSPSGTALEPAPDSTCCSTTACAHSVTASCSSSWRATGRRRFDFASLQSPAARSILDRFGCDPGALDTVYVVRNYRGDAPAPLARAQAALFVMTEIGWPWKAANVLRVLPAALLNAAYGLVARHRYRVFGRYEQCVLPRPEFKSRFLDEEAAVGSRDRAEARPHIFTPRQQCGARLQPGQPFHHRSRPAPVQNPGSSPVK